MVKRGAIYWVDLPVNRISGEKRLRPCLVIQNDALNQSRLNTTVVVAITPILKFGKLPGNVIIEKGEANMPWKGVVNVTQIISTDKKLIEEKIGALSTEILKKVSDGLKLVMELE